MDTYMEKITQVTNFGEIFFLLLKFDNFLLQVVCKFLIKSFDSQ